MESLKRWKAIGESVFGLVCSKAAQATLTPALEQAVAASGPGLNEGGRCSHAPSSSPIPRQHSTAASSASTSPISSRRLASRWVQPRTRLDQDGVVSTSGSVPPVSMKVTSLPKW